MNKIIISTDDMLLVVRKENVECVWKDEYEPYTYYVRMTSGTPYVINKFYYKQIRHMMENVK